MKVDKDNTGIPPHDNNPERAGNKKDADREKFSGIPVSKTPQMDKNLSTSDMLNNQNEATLSKRQHERQVSISSTDSGYESELEENDFIALPAENKSRRQKNVTAQKPLPDSMQTSLQPRKTIAKKDENDSLPVENERLQKNAGTFISERIKFFEKMSASKDNPEPENHPRPKKFIQDSIAESIGKLRSSYLSVGEKKSTLKDNYKVSVSDLIDKFQEDEVVDEEEVSLDPMHALVFREVSKLSIHAALDTMVSSEYEKLKKDCKEENLQKVYERFEKAVEERLASDPGSQIQFGEEISLTETVFDAMWMMLRGDGINFTADQAFDIFIEFNGVDLVDRIERVYQAKQEFNRRHTR